MIDLYDPVEAAEQARQDRRRFVAYSISEWMDSKRWPKLTMLLLLATCFGVAWSVDHLLAAAGIHIRSFRWMPAVLVCWPVFVYLLRWRATAEWRALEKDPAVHALGLDRRDDTDSEGPCSPFLEYVDDALREMRGGTGHTPMGPDLFTLALLGSVTLGGWLLWDLFSRSPKLLTNCLLDAELIPSKPELAGQIETQGWLRETFGSTGVHFIGLAIAGFALAPALPTVLRILGY